MQVHIIVRFLFIFTGRLLVWLGYRADVDWRLRGLRVRRGRAGRRLRPAHGDLRLQGGLGWGQVRPVLRGTWRSVYSICDQGNNHNMDGEMVSGPLNKRFTVVK